MRRYTVWTLVLAAAVALITFQANAFDRAKMDSLVDALSKNNKSIGTVTLAKGGQIVYQRAFGVMDENGTPAKVDTKYRIGSISKMFTTVMIFQLIEENKLALTTPLSKYFPDIPNSKNITIENLLRHSSGLHNFTDDDAYLEYFTKAQTRKQMLDRINAMPADFKPGEKHEYSNTNFVLLGYIIEQVTGKPYAQELKSRITDRIGLENTYYGGKIQSNKNESASFMFNPETKKWAAQAETDMSIPHGAGAVVSSSGDLAKFLKALFDGRLISKENLEKMKTIDSGYGAGMFSYPFNKRTAYGHTGGIDAFSSIATYIPEDDFTFAYVTAGNDYSLNEAAIGMLSIYYDEPYTIPSFKTVSVPKEVLESYSGVYASETLPLEITISSENGKLKAQATGQPAFSLDAESESEFAFKPAGIKLIFSREGAAPVFTLKQNGRDFIYKRKN